MFGSDREGTPSDLAARLSNAADGYTDNSTFDALCHEATSSFNAADETSNVFQGALAALGNFDEGLTVFDAVAQANSIEDTLLDPLSKALADSWGTAWPTPYKTPDYDVSEEIVDRARADYGNAVVPGPRARDFNKVVTASAVAGTALAGKTAQELLRKSVEIAALADDRAKVAAQAREAFQSTLREVDALDREAKKLAPKLLDESGKPRKDASKADLERMKKIRARAVSLGRRAVRFQKVNALATPLAQNAIAQADIAQKLAASVLAGNVGATATLGKMYDEIGKKSAQIRSIRLTQRVKWSKKAELNGFEGFGSLDAYEAGLNALERSDVEALAGLEFSFKKLARGAKRLAKKATVDPVKTVSKIATRTVKGDFKGAFKEVGASVRNAAKDIVKVAGKTLLDYPCRLASSTVGKMAVQAAGQAVGTAYGGPAGGALGSEAGRQAGVTNQSICGGLRKIGLSDGTFRPGRVKSAFSKVAKDIYKTSLSPQAALLAAKNVGMSYASGGLPGGAGGVTSLLGGSASQILGGSASQILSKVGADTLTKIGAGNVQNLVGRQISQLAQRQAKQLVAQQARRVLPSAVPAAEIATEYLQTGRIGDYL